MRISLYVKILIGYLIFGILGFLSIAFFSSNMTLRYLERDRADQLYNEANMIADSCRDRYGSTITAADPLNSQLSSISSTLVSASGPLPISVAPLTGAPSRPFSIR